MQNIALLGDVNILFVFKSLLTTPSNILLLHFKQTFPPTIWTFTEVEGDGIESRLPFKIFHTLDQSLKLYNRKFFDVEEGRKPSAASICVVLETW